MKCLLESEAILQERYLITEILEITERYRIYLAEDQQGGKENCLLREFVAGNVNEVVRVREKFFPILHQLKTLSHPQLEKFKDFFTQGENLYLFL
ncbi:hypothetical protein [Aphanothece sacrum]|uniref:Serine/threonine protein kinase n=1 Tax=Aphanothece sacrum FPU1 TaxID=1920663 RepID=A0A401IL72_APHSA|nr:hypothetical protein [Aphanothece sacrum]GBF81995.1 serine/threonine protein kinase [Aphanothece sacrum FPU1]GBF83625.1 serine/threonine protein kinase [Aphanothece sacrum FPU3]